MQVERRRDGMRYIVEAYGADRELLEAVRRTLPGSYVQWEAQGIPLLGPDSRPRLSGPAFVLWRPAPLSAPADELEDPADFLFDALAPTAPARASAPPPEPEYAPPELAASAPKPERLRSSREELPEPARPAPAQPVAVAAAPMGQITTAATVDTPATGRGGVRGRPKSVKHKNITRVDRPDRKMHGFHVRLGWKRRYYQKWFSDSTHGDRLGALAAAIAWRDAKERELGKPRTEGILKGQDITSNTGLVGVAQVTVKGRPYYRALWRDADGHMHRRWFSIDRLGERRALRAAIKAREEGLAARLGLADSRNLVAHNSGPNALDGVRSLDGVG